MGTLHPLFPRTEDKSWPDIRERLPLCYRLNPRIRAGGEEWTPGESADWRGRLRAAINLDLSDVAYRPSEAGDALLLAVARLVAGETQP